MKRNGKFLSLLLSLAMILSLFVPAMAADAPPAYAIPDVAGKIVILHTNDVHGADVAVSGTSIGTAGVAQLKKDFEAAGAKVLLLSAGDAIMGKPLVSADKGKSAIDFMNAAGYDAMAIGNHELDFGLENLKDLAAQADFPILDSNMTTVSDGKTVFNANKIFTVDGVKVGVFGLSTPETMTKADSSKMPGVTFQQGDKLYELAQAQVDTLKAAGADVIVCLGHLGVDAESTPNRSIDLCTKVNGIDLFIDGHSHSTTAQIISAINNADKSNIVNGAKIVSAGTALANVGMVVYDPTAKTLTDSLISAKEYSAVDADVAKVINDRNTAVNDQYGSVKVGTSEVDLNGTASGGKGIAVNTKAEIIFPITEGLRISETNLGDFSADAILWQARQALGGDDKVDLAITNGGGIRTTVGKGEISMLDLLTVYPFGNTVATIKVTGAQLLEALEASTQFVPTSASGGFPQVSGINFTIKAYIPYVQGDQYPGSTYYAPKNPGDRVTIQSVNGKPFDLKATYTIATNDFTAKGGDTFGVFKRVGGWMDAGITLENALINYTKEVLKGKITAAQYEKSAGRIAIETSAPTSGTSSSKNITTTITTNPDGTKTTTVTDKTTGTVTATTIALNGTKSIVVTKKDGTVSAKVEISAEALKAEEGKTPIVTLPGAALSAGKAPTISITSAKPLTIVIPLADAKPGVVAVLVHADGTEEVLKKSVTTEERLVASLDGSATLKFMNNSKNFSDIPENNWATNAAAFASSRELFQGTSDNTFSPAMPMTRGMLVTVLHRLEGEPEGNKTSFEDVNTNGWYTDAINWANGAGIVTGISTNSFAPDESITRESLAVMLYRYARVLELDTQAQSDACKSYADNGNVSAWAADAMNWAVQNGIITGKNGNTLDPSGIASRAEVAVMIMRFVEKL